MAESAQSVGMGWLGGGTGIERIRLGRREWQWRGCGWAQWTSQSYETAVNTPRNNFIA